MTKMIIATAIISGTASLPAREESPAPKSPHTYPKTRKKKPMRTLPHRTQLYLALPHTGATEYRIIKKSARASCASVRSHPREQSCKRRKGWRTLFLDAGRTQCASHCLCADLVLLFNFGRQCRFAGGDVYAWIYAAAALWL